MSEDKKLFPKVLKLLTKGFLFSTSLSMLLSFIMILGFSTFWNYPIKTETEQIILADLRLNGVILSFTIVMLIFIMERIKTVFYEWALALATASLCSFSLSIFFGFISVLSSSQPVFFPLLPISFTIVGIMTDIGFLLYAVYKFKESV